MEQNVDIPVPSPRPRRARRTLDQNVDLPVPRTRTHGGLQGFSPGQSSSQRIVAPNDDLPVPGPRPSRGFPPGQGSAQWSGSSIFPFLARVLVEVFLIFTFNRVPQPVVELRVPPG